MTDGVATVHNIMAVDGGGLSVDMSCLRNSRSTVNWFDENGWINISFVEMKIRPKSCDTLV